MRHKKISETIFTFIDSETTAIRPSDYGRICEIAIIKRFPDGTRKCYSQLINPQIPICTRATAIHGITNDMVSGKPAFSAIAEKIKSVLGGSVLVFHNAEFDIPFLSYEFGTANIAFSPTVVLDTLKYSRRHGNFTSNTLGNIACELGFTNEGWHRALADAEMTEKIFLYFLRKFKSAGVKTINELGTLQKRKLEVFNEF